MDCGLLRSAIAGESAEQGHRGRICGKRRFLRFADGRAFRLYPKEQFAETVWALQIARSRTPVPLLCAAAYLGIGKPLERRSGQLYTVGNSLSDCVYALRRILGGSDLSWTSV